MYRISTPPRAGCSTGLRLCLCRGPGEDSHNAGGAPAVLGLGGVPSYRLHTGLLNTSLASLAVTYPRCLVVSDKTALPSLAWFASHRFTFVSPLHKSTPNCWVIACNSGELGSHSSLLRQGIASRSSKGGWDPVGPFCETMSELPHGERRPFIWECVTSGDCVAATARG